MKMGQDISQILQSNKQISMREQIGFVWKLSIPAIMAQITSIVMQYIDASMVGSLGASSSAAIGLVASSTWLLGGLCSSISAGFSVLVAQYIGANKLQKARGILKQAILVALLFSLLLAGIGVFLSKPLPIWLGGEQSIRSDATHYFLIYAAAIPFMQMNSLAGSMLQCSGNMKTPGILNSSMCVLDMILNAFFIFPSKTIQFGAFNIYIPGMNLGVMGAAIGTALAEAIISFIMLYCVCFRSKILKLSRDNTWTLEGKILKKALKIATPMAFEHTALCGAMVMATRVVAPLGTIAIAANSFGVTAESLCYMPGYGIAAAATTLVGQSIGAGRKDLAKRFSRLTVLFGMFVMALTGALMYVFSPFMMELLTPDLAVQKLGVEVLRIEVFAEPLFAASIVASGALRGAGDTFIPSIMNLVSIWGVRLTLSVLLVSKYGLQGVWFAMCVELCVRGIIFLIRVFRGKWLERYI